MKKVESNTYAAIVLFWCLVFSIALCSYAFGYYQASQRAAAIANQ